MLIVGFILLLFITIYIFLIFPKKPSRDEYIKFANRSYAHRGFHNNEEKVPENSIEAFFQAVTHGYGIELDIQMTKDKKLIVFHDHDLVRAASDNRRVEEVTYDELIKIKIFDSDEKVPLFSEVLTVVDGKIPIIIEIKSETIREWTYEACKILFEELSSYEGDYCVESFDPFIVAWFRKNAPEIIRGQLSMAPKRFSEHLSKLSSFIASGLLLNFLSRPHFIAYNYLDKSLGATLTRFFGAMLVRWTVTDEATHKKLQKNSEAIIFEGYTPDIKW